MAKIDALAFFMFNVQLVIIARFAIGRFLAKGALFQDHVRLGYTTVTRIHPLALKIVNNILGRHARAARGLALP